MSIEQKKRLVAMLIDSDSFATACDFAGELDVSTRTIYTYLDEIEGLIEEHGCTLEKTPGKGIVLVGDQSSREALIAVLKVGDSVDLDPISRQLAILIKLLNGERLTYQYLADNYYVSRSTIVNDFKTIRELFLIEHGGVQSTNEGSTLSASESDIQKIWGKVLAFQYENIKGHPPINLYHYSTFLQQELSLKQNVVKCLLDEVERVGLNYELPDYYRVHLFQRLAILSYRVSRHHHHDENSGYIFEKVAELETYYIAHDIAEHLKRVSGDAYTLEDELYINQCLVANGVKNKVDAPHRLYYERLADECIERISSILNEPFDKDVQLKNGLINHLIPMCFRLKNEISLQNPYIDQIKKQYSMMFHITWYVLVDIEHELGIKIPEDEIAFLMIHFQSALERKRDIKKILIVTKTGLLTSEILERRIKHVLPSVHIYESLSEEKVKNVNLNKVDLILSTIPLSVSYPPVLSLSSIPSDKELKILSKEVTERLSSQSRLSYKHPAESEEHPIILSLKNRLSIETGLVSTVEEAITKLVSSLEKDGVVEPEYKESVFEREAMSSTSFETGVAIPHGNPKYVKDTRINVFINQKKVSWGGEKVDVIILLSVAKDDMTSISFLIERLYEVMHSREEIERVFFNQSAQSIYRYFARYH